jgi:hypothetical protein
MRESIREARTSPAPHGLLLQTAGRDTSHCQEAWLLYIHIKLGLGHNIWPWVRRTLQDRVYEKACNSSISKAQVNAILPKYLIFHLNYKDRLWKKQEEKAVFKAEYTFSRIPIFLSSRNY